MLANCAARGRLLGLLFAAVASFYFVTAWVGGPAPNWHGQTSEYYPLLTDAFLAGQTSLLLQPPAELLALPDPYDPAANGKLRLHDASLYHGKYYLYFGPAPAIVLFLPYKVLTGSHLATRIAVPLFCAGGFACSCVLFFLLARRENWDCPLWFRSAAVLSLGTAPGISFLLRRPSFYEVGISAGFCFVMAGFLLTTLALDEDSPRKMLLVAAGFCFGFAAGCRPHFALLAILMAVLVAWRARWHKRWVLAFAGPVLFCGVVLAAYNYARFQNPFEFGVRYILAGGIETHSSYLSVPKFVPGVYYIIFSPPWIGLHYPFVRPSDSLAAFVHLPSGFYVAPTIGLLWVAPIAVLGLMMPFACRDWRIKNFVKLASTRLTFAALYVSAVGIMAVIAVLGWIAGRYLADFGPELVLLSWFLLAALWQGVRDSSQRRPLLFQSAVVSLSLYSLLLNLWMGAA